MISNLSSREFNQDTGDHHRPGKPSHVLMTIEDYNRMTVGRQNIAQVLGSAKVADVDFDPLGLDLNLRIEELD